MKLIRFIILAVIMLLIGGCNHEDPPAPTPTRPVKTFRIKDNTTQTATPYPGEVKARYETVLSFRVAGKILERRVDVGDNVRKGQLLARLDSRDYQLAVQGLQAQLKAASAERDFAKADVNRYRELLKQRVISPPDLDRHETAYTAAQEKMTGLQAQLAQAANQLHYTDLHADRDGVITALAAEAGQVVTDGQAIVTLARLDEKEIHIDIPEHRVAEIKVHQPVAITLWATGSKRFKARIREIAAAADPLSRTYRVKATLQDDLAEARLGMTASVWIPGATQTAIAVPLAAIFTPQSEPRTPRVWLVDEQTHTVKSVPVQLGETLDDGYIAVIGPSVGQLLVSAGVQRLTEGQPVRLPESGEAQP